MNREHIVRKIKGTKRRLHNATRALVGKPASTSKIPTYGNGNQVINHPKLEGAKIEFKGKNNIFYCESPGAVLHNCRISFEGDDAVVYWSEYDNKKRKHHINIYAQSKSVVYIGKNVNFHLNARYQPYLMASEGKNIVIGDDCLFSLNLWFRTSDGHAAYDSVTRKRINPGKSILVGDHVWLGQDVSILKGSRIGSGSIVGAGSIVTGKSLASNTSSAGAPARELKQGVFFTKPNINGYTDKQLGGIDINNTDEWIYSYDKSVPLFEDIDKGLSDAKTSAKKLAYIKKHLAGSRSKNRFYIGKENYPPKEL